MNQPDLDTLARAALRRRVLLARADPSEFVRIAGRREGGHPVRMGPVHLEWQRKLTDHDRVVLFAPVGHGKALPLGAEVATPAGWRPIGDLTPGDQVIGGDGQPTTVTWVSPVQVGRDLVEFTFDDGTKVTSDLDHLWSAWTTDDRDEGRPPRTVTTRDICARTTRSGRAFWRVPLTAPVQYPPADLPVDPYVLGAWLARTFTQSIGVCRTGPRGPRLKSRLRALGVLGNKHVPPAYLTASVTQRRDLMAGLMDTDGTVSRTDNRLEFCTVTPALADGVLELARSLGWKATLSIGRAMLAGVDHGPKYRVCWSCADPVFHLDRKAKIHEAGVARLTPGRRRWDSRAIVSWRPVDSVPVRCIAVDADHRTYVVGRGYTVTHNSNQVTRWRLEWEMGRNPAIRIGVVSVTRGGVAAKFMSAIRADIEDNKWLKLVFPHLKRGRGSQRMWSDSGLMIDRPWPTPDPTVQTFGLYGKILGSRLDLIVLDDLCNLENTITQQSRDKMWDWLSGEVFSRLPPEGGGRIWAVGHIWDEDDVMERMRRLPGWHSAKYNAFQPDPDHPGKEVPLIPELWTIDRLRTREMELGPLNSAIMLRNILPNRSAGRVRLEWFEGCLSRGAGMPLPDEWNPANAPTYTGVDLATGTGRDQTCIFTACVLPDGSRRVLDIRTGDWTAPQTLDQLVDVHRRYGSIVAVETNGAQKFLADFATELTALPIRTHTTGANKRDLQFGVESLGLEAFHGKWIIPSHVSGDHAGTPVRCYHETDSSEPSEISKWIRELVAFSPSPKVHTGDRAMASWICREAIRLGTPQDGALGLPEPMDQLDEWDPMAR